MPCHMKLLYALAYLGNLLLEQSEEKMSSQEKIKEKWAKSNNANGTGRYLI